MSVKVNQMRFPVTLTEGRYADAIAEAMRAGELRERARTAKLLARLRRWLVLIQEVLDGTERNPRNRTEEELYALNTASDALDAARSAIREHDKSWAPSQ